MKSRFHLSEVAEMLNMPISEVMEEIEKGYLSYTFHEGEKKVTLYDLEKYMGSEQTQKITHDYMENNPG